MHVLPGCRSDCVKYVIQGLSPCSVLIYLSDFATEVPLYPIDGRLVNCSTLSSKFLWMCYHFSENLLYRIESNDFK